MSANVTFLFTDIEGSTRLWEEQPDAMQEALERHDRLARRIIEKFEGTVFKTVGDAFHCVFPSARLAVEAAVEGQRRLSRVKGVGGMPLRVRMAIHAGPAQERDQDYFGASVNRVSRLLAIGNGGQILLTRQARETLMLGPLPEAVSIEDLGVHRLRDLAQPEHVFEVRLSGAGSNFPSLKSLGNYPNNLPVQISSFVGREKEMSDCRRLLRENRLLTLTGVGGSGKTRLGMQLAAEMLGPDGAFLVEFAPLQSPELVGQTIGNALGVRESAGRPLMEAVLEELRTKRTLLLLDNCEHVIEEAATVVQNLLQRCPLLKILVTTREPLGIGGEVTYKVPPLAVPMSDVTPGPEELAHFEAVRLFVDRATSSQPDFALTTENAQAVFDICRSLEGLPLAIELAAARVRLMRVEQIAQRLDDQFRLLSGGSRTALPRQQTLKALVDWSYNLLSEEERILLDRLSVFVGGWTLEAAEKICGGEILAFRRADVLDVLSRLVDKSLVLYEERPEDVSRYRLLETIRQYAAQKLEERGETGTIRRMHLRYFAEFAETAQPKVQSGDRDWLARVSREHDNLRYALDWCGTARDADWNGLRLAAALTEFWANRGHLTEGRARFRALLKDCDGAPAPVRGSALQGAAVLEASQAEYELATKYAEEAIAIWRELQDTRRLAMGLMVLGNILIQVRRLDAASEAYEEGRQIRQELGDFAGMAVPLNNMGYIAYQQGDLDRATGLIQHATIICRESGNLQGLIAATHSMAMVLKKRGELDKALAVMRESLSIAAERQHHVPVALRLEGVAFIQADLGNDDLATRLVGAADSLRHRIHQPRPHLEQPMYEEYMVKLRERMGDAFNKEFETGSRIPEDEAVRIALGRKPLTAGKKLSSLIGDR